MLYSVLREHSLQMFNLEFQFEFDFNEDFLNAANEIDDCTSESQSDSESLMTDSPPDPEPGSTATSTTTLGEPSQLPVVGPYDLGAIKSSLLGGRLSDDDKCKVLKQLDQPCTTI